MVRARGSGNYIVTPDKIADESLFRLMHQLVIPGLANRTYEKYFADKIGGQITIKRPYQATAGTGRAMAATDFSPLVDRYITLSINTRARFGLQYNDEEMTLDIVAFGDRYLQTGVEEIAYQYDIGGGQALGQGLHLVDGTPGTAITAQSGQLVNAHARQMAIPLNNFNFGLMDPMEFAAISNDVRKNVDNPPIVGDSIRRRFMGMLGNWMLFESVHVEYLECAEERGTPLIRGANQTGDSLATDGWTSSEQILDKGQLIQIANVFEIQPRGNRRKTGRLATFTVTADVSSNGSGQATIPISPELNDGTITLADPDGSGTISLAAFKNVDDAPADNAAITVLGDAGNTYRQSIFFERRALEYVNVQLVPIQSFKMTAVATEPQTGLSVSFAADGDILNMIERRRVDSLFGVDAIYPELGIRLVGSEVG